MQSNLSVSNGHALTRAGIALMALVLLGADTPTGVSSRIERMVESKKSDWIEVRRDLHRHPEVAGNEMRTAGLVAERLRRLGLEVRTGVGGHGVVGVLRGGKPGPVVAYRADMDAMASPAPDPVPFASEVPGVRHICGHDVHTTVALGIAEVLSSMRDELPGTAKFLFQPAEETGEGAKAMIADGALADPVPDAIFAVHCAPLPTGQFGSQAGMLLPGLDIVQVTLSGPGDLAAAAAKCAEIVHGVSMTAGITPPAGLGDDAAASALLPGDFIAAGVFQSEAEGDGWSVTGMVRASSDDMHSRAKLAIEKGLADLGVADVTSRLDYKARAIPAVMNDDALVERAGSVIQETAGDGALIVLEETTPFFSEDFAFFQQQVPGVLFFLGVSNEAKGIQGLPHHPMFAADEDAIAVGVQTMSQVLLDHLARRP